MGCECGCLPSRTGLLGVCVTIFIWFCFKVFSNSRCWVLRLLMRRVSVFWKGLKASNVCWLGWCLSWCFREPAWRLTLLALGGCSGFEALLK